MNRFNLNKVILKVVIPCLGLFVANLANAQGNKESIPKELLKNNPGTPGSLSLVEEFNWQREWGSIHMNTMADGLKDPGVPATTEGDVACMKGYVCTDSVVVGAVGSKIKTTLPTSSIKHGIKFDIKNSVLNCMSRISPNFPSNNGGWDDPFSKFVCTEGRDPQYSSSSATLIYSPIWDTRGNDLRTDKPNGCIRQITNNCANDIHECLDGGNPITAEKPAYHYPLTHVFKPDEIQALVDTGMKNMTLPHKYYEYNKADMSSLGAVLSNRTVPPSSGNYIVLGDGDPTSDGTPTKNYQEVTSFSVGISAVRNPADRVYSENEDRLFKEIKTENDVLARIKTYTVDNLNLPRANLNGFIVVDPSDFFDLRHYIQGGKYDSGYTEVDSSGNPITFETCPIVGLTGYGGICDPTGEAGCNLPIYGIGPQTKFNTSSGQSFVYNNHPIVWSGYVKTWKWISPKDYVENTQERKGENGGILYAEKEEINDSPILMTERAAEYCDARETIVNLPDGKSKEIPCIHYWQYQELKPGSGEYSFVNLFMPEFDGGFDTDYRISILDTYHLECKLEEGEDEELCNPKSPKFDQEKLHNITENDPQYQVKCEGTNILKNGA
ncbi:MAG: hypothetical protein ACPGJV_16310, partial [Bacteriovoracaceae bacterium]